MDRAQAGCRSCVQPLCSGGPDTRANMQWLTVADHRVKTQQDVRVSRYLRKIPKE